MGAVQTHEWKALKQPCSHKVQVITDYDISGTVFKVDCKQIIHVSWRELAVATDFLNLSALWTSPKKTFLFMNYLRKTMFHSNAIYSVFTVS